MNAARWTILGLGLLAAPISLPLSAASPANPPEDKSYQFTSGHWFNGKSFRRSVFYSVDGVLTRKKPARVDSVLDLEGAYVVPPFADAHTHHFDNPANIEQHVGMYLNSGIFYAKVQTSVRTRALKVADRVNRPTSVDVAYAHGGLTSSYGHPFATYEGLALYRRPAGFDAAETQKVRESRLREDDAYYIIDTAEDLERKWPAILAGRPDFIKIYLLDSEEFEERRLRTDAVGHRGLDPKLPPLVVPRAHAAGLRVSAHVNTVTDYRIALEAGVDEMVHLPSTYGRPDRDPRKYELTDQDARETARRRVTVIPSPVAVDTLRAESPAFSAEAKQRADKVSAHNLSLLKRHKVKLAFGSDRFGSTPVEDVLYLQRLGVFRNLEMLRIWCEDTPLAIFPRRKIGLLAEGHEASFLALEGDPLVDFNQIEKIRLRFKQGHPVDTRGLPTTSR